MCSSNIAVASLDEQAFLSFTISIMMTTTSLTYLQNLCLATSKPNTKRSFVKYPISSIHGTFIFYNDVAYDRTNMQIKARIFIY